MRTEARHAFIESEKIEWEGHPVSRFKRLAIGISKILRKTNRLSRGKFGR